jgi:hypothetical protein
VEIQHPLALEQVALEQVALEQAGVK